MNHKGKYVIGEIATRYSTVKAAICFPDSLDHQQIVKALMIDDAIESAGFFSIGEQGLVVSGVAASLGLRARANKDEQFVARALGIALGPNVDWRAHSGRFAKGVTPPVTVEGLEAAWARDQELIDDLLTTIEKQKLTINQLRQASTGK